MALDSFDLSGRVAIVTGGSRGIGKAIAEGFAKHGADVVVTGRHQQDLDAVAEEIAQLGVKAAGIATHMGKPEEIERLVTQTVQKMGRIDIVVNNAASNPYFGPLIEADERAWDQVMNVNLKGPWILCKLAAKTMIEQKHGGSIINVASTGALSSSPNLAMYSTSKAALVMLTRNLARELGKYGIRANTLLPGLVKTRFSEALWTEDEQRAKHDEETPVGRVGEPEDMAGVCVWLASDASSYTTGASFVVDGGKSA